MHRILKVSNYIYYGLTCLLVFCVLCEFTLWFLLDWGPVNQLVKQGIFLDAIPTPEGPVNLGTIALTFPLRMLGLSTYLLSGLPMFYGLWVLRRLFQNYQRNLIFTHENAKKFQKLGWCFFLNALIFKPLHGFGMTLVATFSNPPGHRYMTLTFGTPNLEAIFCGIMLIIISWVMIEAHTLKSEQELTI